MSLLTFKGGVHPNDGKALAKDKAIVQVQPKGDLVYPMSQHIGAPAVPIVAKGDHVLRGQMIAEAGGFVSAPIYASVSGTVKVIEPRFTPAGSKVNSIVIENDGEYEEVEYTGALKVLQMIFSYEYLWIQIRVKGGAYGCMCSFSDQGDSMFVTYRDPNLSESYKVYDEAADYVADFDADDRDMKKYIIGTIGSMDMPMEAVDMGARSFHAYFLGKTEADLQKVRDQVLSCTQEDIRALAPIVKAVVEAGNRCCIGNEEKIDQNKEYFDEVKHVL